MPGTRAEGRRGLGDEGLAEVVIVFPAFLLIVWLALQLAVWGLAAHAAELAAAEGGRAGRDFGAQPGAARQAAEAVLRKIGTTLDDPVVRVVRAGGGTLTVSVTGRVLTVVPGLPLTASATSRGPIQEFRSGG